MTLLSSANFLVAIKRRLQAGNRMFSIVDLKAASLSVPMLDCSVSVSSTDAAAVDVTDAAAVDVRVLSVSYTSGI